MFQISRILARSNCASRAGMTIASTCFALAAPLSIKRTTLASTRPTRKRLRGAQPCRAVLPALAEVATDVTNAATDAAATAASDVAESAQSFGNDDQLLSYLGIAAFVLTVYCTLATVWLSWDTRKRNETAKKQIAAWEEEGGKWRERPGLTAGGIELLDENDPYRIEWEKRQTKAYKVEKKSRKKAARKPGLVLGENKGLNRESRRIAAKQEALEEKERLRKEKLKQSREKSEYM